MELSSEVGIVSCPTIHPWMEQIKRIFPPVLEAFLQPCNFHHLQLSGTILLLSLYPSLAFLLRLHSRHRGRALLLHFLPLQLFYTIPQL